MIPYKVDILKKSKPLAKRNITNGNQKARKQIK